ncbi:MAG: ribose-5-phosphate isomerase RpiA [Betaproteobacteria bacterium]|nr:ribose-5-phosphate isomerase RpiA [Betaproteobacteria bacterium]NBT97922.1 ribose-5-phosphate isomerase RpiA [Betaproteobacteria bacterium]NCX01623.1 ribose-5-phosphate isomerase RpiA [Betaproteobacteria bacterium]
MNSSQDILKRAAAQAALQWIEPGMILGVGTGSTVNHLIDLIGEQGLKLEAAVSSSEASSKRLRALGVPLLDANAVDRLPLYIDGADEVDPGCCLIKGGGGALTREKILADLADRFVCIVDEAKCVACLGAFPLPIEILSMAEKQISKKLEKLGARIALRKDFISDNGHPIIDVSGLTIKDPRELESMMNQWPGVVTVGLFAQRPADLVLIAAKDGIKTLSMA